MHGLTPGFGILRQFIRATDRPARMTAPSHAMPSADVEGGCLRLRGHWTLEHAGDIDEVLRGVDGAVRDVDARGVDRLDSLGVLQLMRYAHKREQSNKRSYVKPDKCKCRNNSCKPASAAQNSQNIPSA